MGSLLITGGTGSLGRAIIKKLLRRADARKIVVLSRDEASQVKMANEADFRSPRLIYHIADIKDQEAIYRAIIQNGVDQIVHAAALKHVPIAEKHPSEAMDINVGGSRSVLQAALHANVNRVVLVSTDKAAQPTNTYGMTKALMERLMPEFNGSKMTVNVTRFGNLVGSRGSVLELFLDQIKRSGKVTVTNPDMTRFHIRMTHAATTVLYALESSSNGLVLVPQMKAATLSEFVKAVFEYRRLATKMDIIGPRPGEKLHEQVVSVDEMVKTRFALDFDGVAITNQVQNKPALSAPISSDTASRMDSEELLSMIMEVGPDLALV